MAGDAASQPPLPWVLLRGLTREQRHWGRFVAVLQAAEPAARIVTLDLPGNGVLHRERSPTRVEAMAEHCRQALQARGVAPPYRVLAMSLGAMVATALAMQRPQDIATLVLINTSLRPFSRWYRRLRPRNLVALLRLALTRPDAPARERTILGLTSNAPSHERDLLQHWAAYRREFPVSAANALRQLWAAARFHAPRARPCEPVLLLASARDGLVDSRCSMALARAWGCALAIHPWA
ncbi:MAG TPA: alpha/beta hydrolase, partial [Burkholderiaceae bacterium]|nr:alpha/beta hydrolase [Burkholderiaceae bacterium]